MFNIFTQSISANNPPYHPTNPQPPHNTQNIPPNTSLQWTGGDPDNDPVTYTIYFSHHYPPRKLIENHPSTTYPLNSLDYSTTYHWMIIAIDINNAITASPIWSFTTIPNPNQPPNPPTNPQPPNQHTNTNLTPTLTWTCSDPNNQTLLYDIYLEPWDQTPDILLTYHQPQTTYTITNPTLTFNTKYFWKIIAWDTTQTYTIGPTWTFTTQPKANTPPTQPNNPQPQNNTTNHPITTNLAWNTTDPDNDPLTYDIYLGTTNPPQKIKNNHTQKTFEPGILQLNTTYYWHIIAWDNHYTATPSPIWTFTTTTQPNRPPNQPTNPTPPHTATNQPTTIQLKATVTDPDNDLLTIAFYNAATTTIISTTTAPSGTQATITWTGLALQTTYHWYIIVNDTIQSNQSDTWTFTTQQTTNQPPTANPAGPYTSHINQPITFDARQSHDNDENQQSITQYDWKFTTNDTWHTNRGPQPTHTYTTPGTYTITLRVTDDENTTATATTTATITQPSITITPTPKHQATNQPITTNLAWNTTNPYQTQVTYTIYFGTTTPPPLLKPNHTQTTYDLPTLNYTTQYHWRIYAYDSQGHTSQNTTWTFTTQQQPPIPEDQNQPPTTPRVTITNAYNTKYGYVQYQNEPVQLTMTSTDPEGDDLRYHISWDDGTSDQSNFQQNGTSYTKEHTYTMLGFYEITVYAEDSQQKNSNVLTYDIQIISEGLYFEYMQIYTGYLIDIDNDETYDIYLDSTGNKVSDLLIVNIPQEELMVYLIDFDFNGDYDVDYNPKNNDKRIQPLEKTTFENKTAYKLDVVGKAWWDFFGSDNYDYMYIPETDEVIKIEYASMLPGSSSLFENPFLYIFIVGLIIIIIELFLVFSLKGIDALSGEKKQKNPKP